MLGTAMPMWATRAAESVISLVNITSAREGVEGHDRSTSGGGHRRQVRPGSRPTPQARGDGLLDDVLRPVRIADLTFPQINRLIHRTRLAFIHLDNLLAFAKRDRDGRVDGYITAHLPDECLLLFFRKGEAVNAASLHTTGRQVVTITEALKRMRTEVERGELAYCAAPMEEV